MRPSDLPNLLAIFTPLFSVFIILELCIWRLGKKGIYDPRDTTANLISGFVYGKIDRYAGIVFGVGLFSTFQFRLFDIGYTWWSLVLCFFGSEVAYYWYHRFAHEKRFLWASHISHHSSQHMNFTVAMRLPWTNIFTFLFVFWMPLSFIGFPPRMIGYFVTANLLYQFWLHTTLIPKLGPIEWIFNTPSHHRVHHARNARYVDANYGGVLIIWDRIFGTCEIEDAREPVEFGLVHNLGTFNPVRIAVHEWITMARDVWHAASWRERWMYLFGPPGWSPDGSRKTSAMLKAERKARLRTRRTRPSLASPPVPAAASLS